VEQDAKFLRWAWVGLVTVIFGYTTIYALAFGGLFSQPDPRELTYQWLEREASSGTTIGLATVPWFYSPPFTPPIIGLQRRQARYESMSQSRFKLVTELGKEWDPKVITSSEPGFVVLSDYEYEDRQRLKQRDYEQFAHEVNKSYRETKVFRKSFSAFGIDFGPTECLPHDMKYMAPTLRVYRRK
jgi:hypothetical protein